MADTRIEVHGLRELRAALKRSEDRSPHELQQANKRAAEIVAREARRRAPKGPHEGKGKPDPIVPIAGSIKAQATAGKGIVAFGGVRSPHGPVYEFGGSIPRRGFRGLTRTERKKGVRFTAAGVRIRSRKGVEGETRGAASLTKIPKRPFVYPAIEAEMPHVLEQYERALIALTSDL